MKEGGEHLHQAEDGHCEHGPEGEDHVDGDGPGLVFKSKSNLENHGPEDLRELSVGQGQGPQTEVGGCVGHRAKDILDGVDPLVDHDLSEAVFCLVIVGKKLVIVEPIVTCLSPGVHLM